MVADSSTPKFWLIVMNRQYTCIVARLSVMKVLGDVGIACDTILQCFYVRTLLVRMLYQCCAVYCQVVVVHFTTFLDPFPQIPMAASPPDTTELDTGRRSTSKGVDYESHPHWAMVDGPDSSVVMNANAPPIGPSSHGQWTDQPTEDPDLEAKYRYRAQHPVAPALSCQSCKVCRRQQPRVLASIMCDLPPRSIG